LNYFDPHIVLHPLDLLDPVIDIRSIYHVYQPIYSLLSNRLVGHEALLRSDCFTPEELFNWAKEANRLYELDTASIYKGISTFYKGVKNRNCTLFVNVFPSTIIHPHFLNFIEQYLDFIPTEKVVFELNECGYIKNYDLLKQTIFHLRKKGIQFALDDVGAGYCSVPRMIALEPEILKLDLSLAQNLSKSRVKQRLIEMFVHYCQKDITLILEGIENPCDLAIAKSLGISIGQGFLLGKPAYLGKSDYLSKSR
jgi:EAL domain-containing protein (putative c-di-GMP-specific phosphodiesterase class I)